MEKEVKTSTPPVISKEKTVPEDRVDFYNSEEFLKRKMAVN